VTSESNDGKYTMSEGSALVDKMHDSQWEVGTLLPVLNTFLHALFGDKQ